MKNNTKCTCGLQNKLTCKNCSTVKMVILLKNGHNDLKNRQLNGKLVNPVWYNHLSKNNKAVNSIVTAMSRRFLNSIYADCTNKIIFYSNIDKQEIATVEL